MSFLEQFIAAIDQYLKQSVKLVIADAGPAPGDDPYLNTGDVWRFRVKVLNHGPLGMARVKVRIEGKNGATVSCDENLDHFAQHADSYELNVPARHRVAFGIPPLQPGTAETGWLYFKAPGTESLTVLELVRARILDWSADLTPLLETASRGADPPSAVYESAVRGGG